MPRVTLDEVVNEGDPLLSTDFLVEMDIPFDVRSVVDSVLNLASARSLSVLCQSVNIPQKSVSTQVVNLYGHSYKFRGKREEDQSLELSFLETKRMPIYLSLNAWFEYVNKTSNGNSPKKVGHGSREGYSTNIYVTIFTVTGERAAEFVFYNSWVKTTPAMQFSGESATPIQVSASFEYDYFAVNPGINIPGLGNIPGGIGGAIRRIGDIFS
jgi:hypothetical protein